MVNCFCSQCRKTSGHHVAATQALRTEVHLEKRHTLKWYRSSAKAQRGFCHHCGGNLFWQHDDEDTISIMAGTIDLPTGLHTSGNIYTKDASDYHPTPPTSSPSPP